jgi:hypothetical protein
MESGSWRWGKLHRNGASVAHAVAASAAYPLFLPAFDETLTFEKDGALKNSRVILTDGGIYDNLGLGCLWPDRSPDVSLNVVSVDTIICCSAGLFPVRTNGTNWLLAHTAPSLEFVLRHTFARIGSQISSMTINLTKSRARRRAKSVRCEHCKTRIKIKTRGRVPKFCSPTCRQLAYERRKWQRPTPVELLAQDIAHAKFRDFVRKEIWTVLQMAELISRDQSLPSAPRNARSRTPLRLVETQPESELAASPSQSPNGQAD